MIILVNNNLNDQFPHVLRHKHIQDQCKQKYDPQTRDKVPAAISCYRLKRPTGSIRYHLLPFPLLRFTLVNCEKGDLENSDQLYDTG